MIERDRRYKLGAGGSRIEIDDAYIGGERTGEGSGRGRRGHTPFIIAVETTKRPQMDGPYTPACKLSGASRPPKPSDYAPVSFEGIIGEALLVLHAIATHRFYPENLHDFRKIIPQYPAECEW